MKYFTITSLALALATPACAQDGTWSAQLGKAMPQTDAMRFQRGLAGRLLVTTDADWHEKWKVQSSTLPKFNEVKSVAKGREVFMLIFFSNPQLDANSKVNLGCDIDMAGPEGESGLHQENQVCYEGVIEGSPYNVYLAAPSIAIKGDPSDPPQAWTVRVTLRDNLRKTAVQLKTLFILE